MAKSKVQYICSECGHKSPKWLGNCPECGRWHTYEKSKKQDSPSKAHKSEVKGLNNKTTPKKLSEINSNRNKRFKSKISEFDRTLGGGFINGSLILIGGEPGVGKSTLTLQIAKSNPELDIFYCAGEESAGQIKRRAERLKITSDNIQIYNETNVHNIIAEAQKNKPDLLIVDSIQTVYRTELTSMAGSVQQVKECAALLQQLAKKQNITTLLIGHVTKKGDIAGPRVLEHMVDTVLQFEGDLNHTYRLLRTIKNRFGAAHEVGVFEMHQHGLKEVLNPSKLFLTGHRSNVSGNAVVCAVEGTRPMLIEVQALVSTSSFGTPQRTSNGFDPKRLAMLLAVLEKRGGYQFSGQDVYLNVAGGIKLNDTAADLGVMSALVSSLTDNSLSKQTVFLGEVGLGGEVRSISRINQRLSEISKIGFKKAIIPTSNAAKGNMKKLQIKEVENSNEALSNALK